ncbi:MAG: amidohydrolase [candidate division Zixibacteria bacterium]|nr:amidohydrolase [candidate division Zixibacteria bacterium]
MSLWRKAAVYAATFVCMASVVQAQIPKAAADLVLKNGVIYTLETERPKAQAIAIVGNRIVVVGTDADVAPYIGADTRVIDLKGQTVLPGLKESHGHLIGIGRARMIVNLVGAKSYKEVIDRVKAAVPGVKPGEWITGGGWHEEKWTDRTSLTIRGFMTHHDLSRAVPDNPVYLTRADGHAGFANAKAMQLMGITASTNAPSGGEIIRDKTGNPTGVFVDKAQALIKVPPMTDSQTRQALELGIEECLANGITMFDDAGVGAETIKIYREYAGQNKLDMRVYVMAAGLSTMRALGKPEVGTGNGFLDVRAVKLVADGALGSRGAALLEPYHDDPGNSGFYTVEPESVYTAAKYALENGWQVCTHAIGDRANRMMLDMYEKAMKEYPHVTDHRFRDEHTQIIDEAEIPRFAKLGVIASMQGIHATSDLPWAGDRLGQARTLEGGYVWQKLLKEGVKIINGTDAPVEHVSPIASFYASVTRQSPEGKPSGGFSPDQRMSREEALRSYTLDAAFGSFREKDLGSVAPGKLADFTVLSKDIMTVPEDQILQTEVVYTIVDGKVRYERSKAAVP